MRLILCLQALADIKNELKDKERSVKTVAVRKLVYVSEEIDFRQIVTNLFGLFDNFFSFRRRSSSLQLHMLGYDISWAAFNIVEVISETKFAHKRVGYLAASQVKFSLLCSLLQHSKESFCSRFMMTPMSLCWPPIC